MACSGTTLSFFFVLWSFCIFVSPLHSSYNSSFLPVDSLLISFFFLVSFLCVLLYFFISFFLIPLPPFLTLCSFFYSSHSFLTCLHLCCFSFLRLTFTHFMNAPLSNVKIHFSHRCVSFSARPLTGRVYCFQMCTCWTRGCRSSCVGLKWVAT
jgi:hypothetical protein